MNTVQVIPTEYHNTQLRSRLEARWAVCFDTLGIRWEYEPEAFGDGKQGYLPDFWLPEQKTYVEIKPSGDLDYGRTALACVATGRPVIALFGRPGTTNFFNKKCDECFTPEAPYDSPHLIYASCGCPYDEVPSVRHEDVRACPEPSSGYADNLYCLSECAGCGYCDFSFSGWQRGHSCKDEADIHSPRLHAAYQTARRYRFWNPS